MRTIAAILESVKERTENARKEIEEKRAIRAVFDDICIRDPYWKTKHLTVGEFELWYRNMQEIFWKEYSGRYGKDSIKCADCERKIDKPQELLKWAGAFYHAGCFIKSVEDGKHIIDEFSWPYYNRLTTVFL